MKDTQIWVNKEESLYGKADSQVIELGYHFSGDDFSVKVN